MKIARGIYILGYYSTIKTVTFSFVCLIYLDTRYTKSEVYNTLDNILIFPKILTTSFLSSTFCFVLGRDPHENLVILAILFIGNWARKSRMGCLENYSSSMQSCI